MNGNANAPEPQVEPIRTNSFVIVVGVVFIFFIVRLFALQFVEGQDWVSQAEENRTETISLPTRRGVIYDRNGIILARNIASYNIAITPANLPDDQGEIDEIIRELAEFVDLPISQGSLTDPLIDCGDNLGISEMVAIGTSFQPFAPILIECDVDRDLALAIIEKSVDWPGVSVEIEPVRDYPTGNVTSTFIGFLGPIPQQAEEAFRALGFIPNRDKVGYAGVELYFDELLRGQNGVREVEVDVAGEALRDIESIIDPREGYNVRLTVDMRLQLAMDSIIQNEIDLWHRFYFGNTGQVRISSGVIMAINPQTGEVLGMVSWPAYENNRLARFIPTYYYTQLISDATQPLLNHAVGAELPAGSVFKIVTSVGALNEGVVTPDQVLQAPPSITIQNVYTPNDPGLAKEFVDWNDAGFGQLNFLGGISNSSNVYFYKLAGGYPGEVDEGLGICRLGTYGEAMGYNQILGIELPDETDGLIPDPTWKRINQGENWSTGDTYIAGVGQGFVISTPMQVLMSAATIANNGTLMRPTIVRDVVDNEGNVIPVVFDQFGNLLPSEMDAFGQIIIQAYDASGDPIEVTVLDATGNLYQPRWDANGALLNPVYDIDGDLIEPILASPFVPDPKWDLTVDPKIAEYENPAGIGSCKQTGNYTTVEPWVFQTVQAGMRQAVINGTLEDVFSGFGVPVAGKTGTAEYCDVVALSKNLCIPGNWPTHSWTVAYAPYDNPEIAVVAFMYNGGEGASVAGPVVRRVIETYFNLKAIDAALGRP